MPLTEMTSLCHATLVSYIAELCSVFSSLKVKPKIVNWKSGQLDFQVVSISLKRLIFLIFIVESWSQLATTKYLPRNILTKFCILSNIKVFYSKHPICSFILLSTNRCRRKRQRAYHLLMIFKTAINYELNILLGENDFLQKSHL